MTLTARSCAFIALQKWLKKNALVSDTLREITKNLAPADRRFAFELASGTIRRFWTIEWYAKKLVAHSLPKDASQRLLLFMALYQRLFHANLPPHALIFEYVELAKKTCNAHFASFLNAVLRKSLQIEGLKSNEYVSMYKDKSRHTPDGLSILFSYHPSFIRRLLSSYGEEETVKILEAENIKLPTFRRGSWNNAIKEFPFDETADEEIFQNPTQPLIFGELSQRVSHPHRILDLCAGSGGKTLMAWEVFQPDILHANDSSAYRLERLRTEIESQGARSTITCCDGLTLSEEEKFDLVIVDPPCSNSGVLFKCPEARHRLTDDQIHSHQTLQLSLLKKSARLLQPNGVIMYTTCSILPDENIDVLRQAASELHLTIQGGPILILPDGKRFEGGFGAILALCSKGS
jgi:16S rRNA (cytosine967-C5)-methyltransferase